MVEFGHKFHEAPAREGKQRKEAEDPSAQAVSQAASLDSA